MIAGESGPNCPRASEILATNRFWPANKSMAMENVPLSLHIVAPAKASFLLMRMKVFCGQAPVMVTGKELKTVPARGEVIIADWFGAGPRTVPDNPTDPVWGLTAGTA